MELRFDRVAGVGWAHDCSRSDRARNHRAVAGPHAPQVPGSRAGTEIVTAATGIIRTAVECYGHANFGRAL
jgi:hypothetical protein